MITQTYDGFITVATPKLIRELMNVDGLTNDEVKSHLQVRRVDALCITIVLIQNQS